MAASSPFSSLLSSAFTHFHSFTPHSKTELGQREMALSSAQTNPLLKAKTTRFSSFKREKSRSQFSSKSPKAASTRRPAEKFENAALFLRLSLPSTLICHENGGFRKRFSNGRNLKTPAFRYRKYFENGAFSKTMTSRKSCDLRDRAFLDQTEIQNDR